MSSISHPTLGFNLELAVARLADGWEVPLFVAEQRKPVAGLSRLADGTVELHKSIRASVHLTDSPPAIAFDGALFRLACELGAVVITVRDVETGSIYRTDVQTFDRYAFNQDRRHGSQRFLKLRHWSINGAPPAYAPPAAHPANEQHADQLSLFGGGQ